MAEKSGLELVLALNRGEQNYARYLNVRCGENLFRVYSLAELEAFFMERLVGNRNIREVADVEVLRLPLLDEEMIALVLEENPDKIRVLNEDMSVSYQQGAPPRVTITEQSTEGRRWLELPDEGIKLLGGRAVEIVLVMGWNTVANNKDIPALKEKMRGYLNGNQWSAWTTKPTIVLPDPVNNAEFPALLEVEYGKCVVTGVSLVAYGAICSKSYRSYYDTSWFESRWCLSADEAQKVHNAAAVKFAELRVEAIQKAELDAAKKVVAEVQARIRELYNDSRLYDSSDSSLRGEIYNRAYSGPSSSAKFADLEEWQAQARELIVRAEAALVEVDRKKAIEEARRANAAENLLVIMQEHYAVCPVCGQAQEWTAERAEEVLGARKSSHQFFSVSCTCGYGLDGIDQARDMIAAIESGYAGETGYCDGRDGTIMYRTLIGDAPLIEAVAYYKYGHYNLGLVLFPQALMEDGGIISHKVWHQPTEREVKIAALTRLHATYEEDVARAEEEVANGYARKLQFRLGKNTKTQEEQWEAGSRKSGLFLVDRRNRLDIQPDKRYYCRDVRTLVDSPTFKLITVEPYLEAGRNIEAELAELLAQEQAAYEATEAAALEQTEAIESKGEVTTDMLAVLAAKFGK